MTPYERVMARIERQGECLVSLSAPDDHGYSRVMVEGKPRFAHRIVWEHHYGPIPEGLGVLHHCDNPPCVETEPTGGYPHGHLFTGTQADNLVDMASKGRHRNQRKTHCVNGYEFTEENTYRDPDGSRECRVCRTAADRARRMRERSQ